MWRTVVTSGLALMLSLETAPAEGASFKEEQRRFPRVRSALKEKTEILQRLFEERGVEFPPPRIFLRAFKHEGLLELWVWRESEQGYSLLKTYPICSRSGELGPKRQQGDLQVPEGFYYLDRFNPASNFHLSLGIDYPNASDRLLGVAGDLGGDIFIHGACVTIGCIPVTTDLIKEVYVIALEARVNGQGRIPVHIFPSRLDTEQLEWLETQTADAELLSFWRNLQPGYTYFEQHRRLPKIIVGPNGQYLWKK